MAAYYTTAALALLRWVEDRHRVDLAWVVLFAAACTQVKNPGWFWAATLVPGFVVAYWPRHGVRIEERRQRQAGVVELGLRERVEGRPVLEGAQRGAQRGRVGGARAQLAVVGLQERPLGEEAGDAQMQVRPQREGEEAEDHLPHGGTPGERVAP